MKGIKQLAFLGLFVFTSVALANIGTSNNTKTSMSSNWICTTNASSSSVEAEKAADDKMANTAGSAASSFAFATSNCRDCTKITCELQD